MVGSWSTAYQVNAWDEARCSEVNTASHPADLPGWSATPSTRTLSIFSTAASGAQARATWYILNRALWPVTGSGLASSFLAAAGGAGCSEQPARRRPAAIMVRKGFMRSEEHTSELQSLRH